MKQKKNFQITLDGKKINVKEGQTILEIAEKEGIEIPSLCFHPDLDIKSSCRLCVVEIKGKKGLHTACSTKIEPGMEIITNSPEIRRAIRINLELIFAQHCEECEDCIWRFNCELLNLARKYKVEITRFPDRKTGYPVYEFGPSLIFDSSKCIDCRNCVDVCEKQRVEFLETKEKGHLFQVIPSKRIKRDCIYCGQCIVHCPVGAFESVDEFENIEKPFQGKDKIIVQFAPSIRTSIGEEFNLPHGSILTGKLTAAIKRLGAYKVFDVSVGADFTTTEEANELIERLEQQKYLPMFTSCCPAWVKFVEFYYPEFIPYLTTVRSPHIILGGLIKNFWARKEGIDPKKIRVVSIMPCVAKKYEIKRDELKIKGIKPVDYVLTTRELAFLLDKKNINLKEITPEKPDSPLGLPTGGGVIYGASGGVMESALRTACERLTSKKLCQIEYNKARGMEGTKKANIKIGDRLLKIAVVNGIGNARKILEELKEKRGIYDFVEVMACFGGCVGGGGQPVPTNAKTREERAKGLYKIDTSKEIRLPHQNPIVKKVYKDFLNQKESIHLICHTEYSSKPKEVNT